MRRLLSIPAETMCQLHLIVAANGAPVGWRRLALFFRCSSFPKPEKACYLRDFPFTRKPCGKGTKKVYALTSFSDLLIAWAFLWALVAAVFDVRFHRIPNWLTYSGMLAALAARLTFLGMPGLVSGLVGGLFAGGIFLLFFMVRAMGGGDVKLIAALGTLVGWPVAVELLIATAMAGGLLAIGFMIFQGKVSSTLRNLGAVLKHHATQGVRQHPSVNLDNPEAARMPYGLAMAAGALFCFSRALLGR